MNKRLDALLVAIACLLMLPVVAYAQLPSPTYGWNLGNTLEPPCGEGCWGPAASQNLINAVANAGFNTVRIPCAWNSNANQSTYQINATYMARVKQIVDWCIARNMSVIINSHWDNGWLENNITGTVNSTINAKQNSYWTQIANTFKNYDNRVLFASANEPDVDTAAEMSTLTAYHQTFINAVRATGGNNTSRWLVIQGPRTDIDLTDQLMNTLPNDPTSGRLAIEVHFYSPYQFTLMTQDESWGKMFYFWGQAYHHATRTDRNANHSEEAYIDAQFDKMRNKFVNQGRPVIVGEFQAFKRTGNSDLTGNDFNLHVASRTFFHKSIVDKANSRGLKPIYWDIQGQMFDWSSGNLVDADNERALTGGTALPPPGGGGGTFYKFRNVGTSLYMDGMGRTNNGANCGQYANVGSFNQQWARTTVGSFVKLQNRGTGLFLDGMGRNTNGSICGQYAGGSSNNQQWTETTVSGNFKFQNRGTGLFVDGMGRTANGSDMGQWASSSSNNQRFARSTP
jgi:endoglucanase